ncbi:MAG: nitrite/sulfite reductase [Hyphomicrobiales bacterium]|nr:nitrite/sulfite reductase [Hyphomicrobiales bacterium]MCP5371939.1 nitrite/sulfite reductase [Hyphomicrobiales bacterium]
MPDADKTAPAAPVPGWTPQWSREWTVARPGDLIEFRDGFRAYRAGRWDPDRWTTFRLRFGVYAQRQVGRHMVRARVPGGRLGFAQLRTMAAASRAFCDGDPHITTRQDVQFYGLREDDLVDFLAVLAAGGVSTREASGNTFRNVTACPLAGICPQEHVDAGEVAQRLSETWIRHPLVQHMPRKFKTTVSGCGHDCGLARIDDLGLVATERDGRKGFRVYAGGGLGIKPRPAVEIADFVTEADLPAVQEALARLHQRFSNRKRKMASRLKFLVDRFGAEEFTALFRAEFDRARALPGRPWRPLDWRAHRDEGAAPPLPAGRVPEPDGAVSVVVRPPLGLVDPDRLEAIADLAEQKGAREVRLTRDQNLIVAGVAPDRAAALAAALRALGFEVDGDAHGLGNLVACPGTSTCPIGVTNSYALARELLARGDAFADLPELKVRLSGCHNSCGQHHIGDIGLHGVAQKVDGRPAPFYELHLGGEPAPDGRVGLPGPAIPARRAPAAVAAIARAYGDGRGDGESLRRWAARLGADGIAALLAPILDDDGGDPHRDWGQDGPFTTGATGAGECASPVVVGEYLEDLSLARLEDVDRHASVGDLAGARAAALDAAAWAGKRLLLVAGAAVRDDGDADRLGAALADHDGDLGRAWDAARAALATGDGPADWHPALAAWRATATAAVDRALAAPLVPQAVA